MKKQSVKQLFAGCLAVCLVLSLAACGRGLSAAESEPPPANSGRLGRFWQSALHPESESQSQSQRPASSGARPGAAPKPGGTGGAGGPGGNGQATDGGQAALEALRAKLEAYPDAPLAAAYFGEPDLHDARSIAAYLQEHFSDILEIAPFLLEIPEENIIGTGPELYCLIPRDDATSVSINLVAWDVDENWENAWPTVNDILYRSEYAAPLFVCVDADPHIGLPNAQVLAVANNGAQVEWYPAIDFDSFTLACPTDEASNPLICDLAMLAGGDDGGDDGGYDGGYGSGYGSGYDVGDGGWYAPTALGLMDTTWWVDGTGWYMAFSAGDGYYTGTVEVYEYPRGSAEHTGVWEMEDDMLYLQAVDDVGNVTEGRYPVKISPSGEELTMQADPQSGALPDFWGMADADAMHLTLVYG